MFVRVSMAVFFGLVRATCVCGLALVLLLLGRCVWGRGCWMDGHVFFQ